MGISPVDVKHLMLEEKQGLGTCNLEKITVLGEPIEKVSREFRSLDIFPRTWGRKTVEIKTKIELLDIMSEATGVGYGIEESERREFDVP